MNKFELAKSITHLIESLEHRIINVGAKEYDLGQTQKIESKTLAMLLDESIEELNDLIVYLAFTRIKIQKLRANLSLEVLDSPTPPDYLS